MRSILPNRALKLAFVVDDLDEYLERFATLFGLQKSESIVTGPEEETQIEYRDMPTAGRARIGYIPLENIVLELIEPIDGPSIWRSFLEKKGCGLHHIGFIVDDLAEVTADLVNLDLPCVQRGLFPGMGSSPSGTYTYHDSIEQLGFDIELLQFD